MIKQILLSPWTALLTPALVVGVRVADPSEDVRLAVERQIERRKYW